MIYQLLPSEPCLTKGAGVSEEPRSQA